MVRNSKYEQVRDLEGGPKFRPAHMRSLHLLMKKLESLGILVLMEVHRARVRGATKDVAVKVLHPVMMFVLIVGYFLMFCYWFSCSML
jgi:hypothetical protein